MPTPAPEATHFFTSPLELRSWLETHHATARELWLGYRPRASGLPTLSWAEAVDECLCFGWIDGVRVHVEGGWAQRLTPRREGSIWSARNVGRYEALRREGRVLPAGEAAYARRRDDRTAIYSYESAPGLDSASEAGLRANAAAWAFWEAQPAGYRRVAAQWIASAKRPETRLRRLSQLITDCANGRRLVVVGGSPGR